jgi:arsenate reductase
VTAAVGRRLLAELLGTGLLVTAVVGSGIAASRLSTDGGMRLWENTAATCLALGVLIVVFGPVSGAHFNPLVTLTLWWNGRHSTAQPGWEVAGYLAAQCVGAVGGAVLGNVMFGLPAGQLSQHARTGPGLWTGEVVATAGLVLLVLVLVRTGRERLAPVAVAAWIGGAYWFTSSTSFANPAVTLGRVFTNTYAGISGASVPTFLAAQAAGALVAVAVAAVLYPVPRPRPGLAAADPVPGKGRAAERIGVTP